MGLITLAKNRPNLLTLFKANVWLFMLHFYALISIGWSDFPGVSLKRWIRIVGSLIMAMIVLIGDDYRGAFEHVFRRYASICITLSVVLVRFYPRIGFVTGLMGTRSWAGVASHKNELAIICAFSLVFFLWRFLKSRPSINMFDIIPAFMCVYLLMRARSATADITALLGLFILFSMTLMKGNLKKIILFTLIISFISFLVFAIFINQSDGGISGTLFRAAGRDSTLTGRIPIWQYLLKLGSKDLIGGSGYESFWIANLANVWARFAFGPTNAHSGYVDVILNLGIFGLVILLVLFGKSLVKLGEKGEIASNYGRIIFIFFVIILLRNLTESSIMNLSLSWFLFLLCSINVKDSFVHIPVDELPPP